MTNPNIQDAENITRGEGSITSTPRILYYKKLHAFKQLSCSLFYYGRSFLRVALRPVQSKLREKKFNKAVRFFRTNKSKESCRTAVVCVKKFLFVNLIDKYSLCFARGIHAGTPQIQSYFQPNFMKNHVANSVLATLDETSYTATLPSGEDPSTSGISCIAVFLMFLKTDVAVYSKKS